MTWAVAQSVERLSKGPRSRCNSTDVGSNHANAIALGVKKYPSRAIGCSRYNSSVWEDVVKKNRLVHKKVKFPFSFQIKICQKIEARNEKIFPQPRY